MGPPSEPLGPPWTPLTGTARQGKDGLAAGGPGSRRAPAGCWQAAAVAGDATGPGARTSPDLAPTVLAPTACLWSRSRSRCRLLHRPWSPEGTAASADCWEREDANPLTAGPGSRASEPGGQAVPRAVRLTAGWAGAQGAGEEAGEEARQGGGGGPLLAARPISFWDLYYKLSP